MQQRRPVFQERRKTQAGPFGVQGDVQRAVADRSTRISNTSAGASGNCDHARSLITLKSVSKTRGPIQSDRYVEVLGPLFDPDQHMRVDRLFEFVCCLIRAGGIEDQGWDPILESTALIDDLSRLSTEPLDPQKYAHPERTRARLALLSYCHVMEADFFYHVLANLSRLRAGAKYDMDPFRDLRERRKQSGIPPALGDKIRRVNELAAKVGVDTASIFAEVHFKDIRNSVFHADYTVTETEFRMLQGLHKVTAGSLTPRVPFDELDSILRRSFAFYSAIMALHRRTRHRLSGFKHKILPYDDTTKDYLN